VASQVLGKRLGKGMGAAAEAIKKLTTADIVAYEATGTVDINDLHLREGDLKVHRF
jgi:isoleucyl-tRNA synthetase